MVDLKDTKVIRFDLAANLSGLANSADNPLGGIFRALKPGMPRIIVKNPEPGISFEQRGLPRLAQIPISSQLLNAHPLAEYIGKSTPLSSFDIKAILASSHLDLSISGYHGGAVAAAVPSKQDWNDPRRYDRNVWLRDWALNFFAFHRAGHRGQSHAMIDNVFQFLGSSEHRGNITGMHFQDSDPATRFANNERIPHTKFSIDANGKLTWCTTDWAHQQIDALTASIGAVYRAANIESKQELKVDGALRLDLRRIDPMQGHCEHILPAMVKALKGIRIWDARDVGPWEDYFQHQRATGNGLATSMTREIKEFHERCGWNFLNVEYGEKNGHRLFKKDVADLGYRCKEVLDRRIPESGFAIECNGRPHDAAMLLLLYPFKADLSSLQEYSILRTAYANMGEVGFSRFIATLDQDIPAGFDGHPSELAGTPDTFVGQDYHHNLDPNAYGEFAPVVKDYKAAQWSLFDPLLAGYYFRRFVESGGIDTEAYLYGDRHLKRSLAFITKEDTELVVAGKGSEGRFIIPKGSLPEAMMWDSKQGKFLHNHNNLLMSRAALALALERAIEAARYFELLDVRASAA